ncbi:hypothetical protein [Anaerostipes hadrus]|uniref:hypothetical protein n=1 Tax=Anaerostipes hadrus TaxID=649756 RepID=UPI00156E9779|nr:hypothetical protein [Anaerostipes hadrus]NSG57520.1 hypothetical protein [Anaerostipes hadrus]
MVYTVKLDSSDDKVFNLMQFNSMTFDMECKLVVCTDDLKAVKSAFTNFKTLDIYRDDVQIATYTCFNNYKEISLQQGLYNNTNGEWEDALIVSLTRANIVEQVQRLDEKVNQVVDINTLSLDEYKNYLQEKNKAALAEFLADQSVEFNGKPYGVSEEDQNEMALNFMQYQALTTAGQQVTLEWHSKKSACETFTAEEFVQLTAMIKAFVYPYFQQMNVIKQQIFSSTSKEELGKIEIKYEVIPVQSTEPTTPSDGKDSTTTDKTDETGKDSVTTEE